MKQLMWTVLCHRYIQYPHIPVFLSPELLAVPSPFGGPERKDTPQHLIYNALILESRLWNLRGVLWFVCSWCEVAGQGVLDAKKGGHPKRAALSWWGRLVSSIDQGLKGTSVLLLATAWNPHATVCSSRLSTSDGLSVWGEVYTE